MSVTTAAQYASVQPTDTAGKPGASYVPLVGRIAAGGPILAEESAEEDVFPFPRQSEVLRADRVEADGRAREMAAPFVALGPSGAAVRDRLKHLTAEDEKALRLVGDHLRMLACRR
jgi:hypothetical protein